MDQGEGGRSGVGRKKSNLKGKEIKKREKYDRFT